ncbi:MAG TPA: ATP-binding protein [Chloroflexota bacterium]|nr:ATP-binding protein [Chloroflexota bacterium]
MVTLIGLLVLAGVFSQLLRQRSINIEQRVVEQQAKSLQADVNLELSRISHLTPNELFAFFAHDSRLLHKQIIWFNASGTCAFDSRVFQLEHGRSTGNPCRIPGMSDWQIVPVASAKAASEFVHRGSNTYLVYQEPTRAPGQRTTAVVLVTNASAVIPSLSAVSTAFLLAAAASAVVWVFMALYFAYGVSRPLLRVSQAARAMATGDYSQRVDVKGGGEIAELGRSFNEMAAQVGASHQLLRDFVANVSHDLRTPLTLISGYAQALKDGTAEGSQNTSQAATVIVEETGAMQRLIDDLLQLTRLESGLARIEREPASLRFLAAAAIERVGRVTADGRPIENEIPAAMPLANVDRGMIDRALTNLLSNAVAHTPRDTRVEVSASVLDDQWLEVRVSDSGPGIRPEDRERIFERFYRLDRGRSRDDGHSGLGLAIVREIVEAHGGHVWVDVAKHGGASFAFTIPRQ